MKKFVLLLTCVTLAFSLVSCGNSSEEETEKKSTGAGETVGTSQAQQTESGENPLDNENNDIDVPFDNLLGS